MSSEDESDEGSDDGFQDAPEAYPSLEEKVASPGLEEVPFPAAATSPVVPPLPARNVQGTPPPLPTRNAQGTPPLPAKGAQGTPPPLPPRKRQPFFLTTSSARIRSQTVSSMTSSHKRASFSSTANYDLLLSRLDVKEGAEAETGRGQEGLAELKEQYFLLKDHLQQNQSPPNYDASPDEAAIDWPVWTRVVTDYAAFARSNPVDLSLAIASGVPHDLRRIVWQAISGSKSQYLEELYASIVSEPSPHEKAIRRDLSRTSFIRNIDSESLFKIIKAYSLFDPEVGYTQGMTFITVPILINLPEVEAFCLLVKLMKDYGFREFFLYEMPGLHLRLYQFDRILEDTIPDVHIHLSRQGVRSSMFASQWFLTLFAYKFPLQIVLRIFDVVMAEGIEAMLRFAVGLIRRNASTILSLEFEPLLAFLKENIFDYYMLAEPLEMRHHSITPPLPPRGGSPIVRNGNTTPVHDTRSANGSTVQYRVNDLVADAYDIKVLPVTLQKYTDEYNELTIIENERLEEVEALRNDNGLLTQRIRRLEATVASLTNEHLSVTNDLAHERIRAAELADDNEELQATKDALDAELRAKLAGLGEGAADELVALRKDNIQLSEAKQRQESQLAHLEQELAETKNQLTELEIGHKKLLTRWENLKRAMSEE